MSYESGPWGDGMNEPMKPVKDITQSFTVVRLEIPFDYQTVEIVGVCPTIERARNLIKHDCGLCRTHQPVMQISWGDREVWVANLHDEAAKDSANVYLVIENKKIGSQ